MIGIDGLAGSGKTTVADELGTLVAECGLEVIRITLDAYLTSEAAFGAVAEDVLRPLTPTGSGRYRTAPAADGEVGRWAVAPEAAVVIVDGLFLHHPTLAAGGGTRTWDFSVWLDVPIEQAYARLHIQRRSDPDPRSPSNMAWTNAQLRYIETCDPARQADVVVDNSQPHASTD